MEEIWEIKIENTHFVYKLAISTTPLDDGDDDRSRII